MKELNKLIEGIAFPLRYEESNNGILDANNQWVCEVYGGLADGNLIAHALNNLGTKSGDSTVSVKDANQNGDNLQPKEGEEIPLTDEQIEAVKRMSANRPIANLRPQSEPVSEERTGEESEGGQP